MISYMFISIFVLSLSAFLTYNIILGILKNTSSQATIQAFQQTEQNIDDFFQGVDNLSKTLKTEKWVQNFISVDNSTELERLDLLRDFSKSISKIFVVYNYIDSVFIYTKKGDVFGISRTNSWNVKNSNASEMKFLSSESYSMVEKLFPDMIIMGNYTNDDFYTNDQKYTGRSKNDYIVNFISAVRGIKPLYGSQVSAELVININESKLNTIYGKLSDDPESTYIMDGKGFVISSFNSDKIGKKSPIFPMIDKTLNDGSFTYKNSSMSEQIVFYKLDKTGWFLIHEVPYHVFTKNVTKLKNITFIAFVASLMIIFIVYTFWINKIMKPLRQLVMVMKEVGNGNIGLTVSDVPKNEIGVLIEQFNRMSTNVLELVEKNKNVEEKKRKLEVEILQAQINPHFLYNTLNAIKWMAAIIKAKNIVDSITILGNLIRPIFNKSDVMCTLKEEMEYLINYKEIMSYRYDENILLDINIIPELMYYKILRFTLQPLLENSLMHGLIKGVSRIIT